MSDQPYTLRSYISGPKWAKLPEAFYDLEQQLADKVVSVQVTRVAKRFLTETVFFEISGPQDDVLTISNAIIQDCERYNV
jgi:hypothetical protein